MPFCKKKKDDGASVPPFTVQKVVIPKGMINPNETTIIEIPARLHDQPLVIAKRKINATGWTSETMRRDPDDDYYDDMLNRTRTLEKMRKQPPAMSHSYRIDDYSDFQPQAASSFKEESMFYKSNRGAPLYSAPTCKSPDSYGNESMYATAKSRELEETEREEKIALEKNLVDFQKARRKLLSSASHLVNQTVLDDPINGILLVTRSKYLQNLYFPQYNLIFKYPHRTKFSEKPAFRNVRLDPRTRYNYCNKYTENT